MSLRPPADGHDSVSSGADGRSARSAGLMCRVARRPAFFPRSTRAGSWRSTHSALAYSPRSRRTCRIFCLSTSVMTVGPARHRQLDTDGRQRSDATCRAGSGENWPRRSRCTKGGRLPRPVGWSWSPDAASLGDPVAERGRSPIDTVADHSTMPLEHLRLRWMAEQPNSWRGLPLDAPFGSGFGSTGGHGRLLHGPGRRQPRRGKYERLGPGR